MVLSAVYVCPGVNIERMPANGRIRKVNADQRYQGATGLGMYRLERVCKGSVCRMVAWEKTGRSVVLSHCLFGRC